MLHVELVKLAELQIEQGDLNKAKQFLSNALQYNPNYSWGNLRMANILLKENLVEHAERYLLNIHNVEIKSDINLNNAINILEGDINRFKGEYEQAIYHYDQAITFSTNSQILKSALQKQLKILTSVYYSEIERLINKYFYINEEITTHLILYFYQICTNYNLYKYIDIINNKYIYNSYELFKYKVNRLLLSGNLKDPYILVSKIDLNNQVNKYQTFLFYAEINEFSGNVSLSIKCLEQALLIKKTINLEIKKLLIIAEYNFDISAKKITNLLSKRLSEFKTEDFQLLLNNVKYKGAKLFEYFIKYYQPSKKQFNEDSLSKFSSNEYKTILLIKKYINDIKSDQVNIDFIFNYLENIELNAIFKREILIQIYNCSYEYPRIYFSFIEHLNGFISSSDLYYKKLIKKQNKNNKVVFNNLFTVVLNSTNVGDTILYLFSLYELYQISGKKVILITCFENKNIISIVKGDWIESTIFLARQDIVDRYCPYQEIRPVSLNCISYLSQGGKDRLTVSTEDNIWGGNFLNFRRLNVLDYYLKKTNNLDSSSSPYLNTYYAFNKTIKHNVSTSFNQRKIDENIIVIAPIANSLGYYYNLSEMNQLWIVLINYLISLGFNIRILKSNKEFCNETNNLVQSIVSNYDNNHQVSELDIGLIEFVKYMENAECFIGVRSGICDLINFISSENQKRICIYPPTKVKYCFGLAEWKFSNFLEYQLPKDYINDVHSIIPDLIAFLEINLK